MENDDRAGGRRLDALAVERALRRMAQRAEPPWLHAEAARRLAERLAPMRAEPARVLDWGAGPGGGQEALRRRYPKSEIVAVEPDAAWLARAGRSSKPAWWPLGRARSAPAHVAAEPDAAIGRAGLVWANMVLHGVVDPPALFARWHALLAVDGVVAFSCLGPGTLAGLRELYASLGWPAPTRACSSACATRRTSSRCRPASAPATCAAPSPSSRAGAARSAAAPSRSSTT